MNKPNGYDTATAFTGEYETIILGGHKAIITDAYEQNYSKNGNTYNFLVIEYDFDKGDKQFALFEEKVFHRPKNEFEFSLRCCNFVLQR